MGPIIAIANQKGGVGKTATAVNLCAELAQHGPVLLVDVDPQANATSSLGVPWRNLQRSVYQVLLGSVEPEDAIIPTGEPGLSLLPATSALAGAQVELTFESERESRLRKAIDRVNSHYMAVILDCPPSLGLLTINALVASCLVIVPVQCEFLAMEGLGQLLDTMQLVQESANQELSILGFVLTMYDSRTALSQQVASELRRMFPALTFQTAIPRSVRLSEAPSHGKSVRAYAPFSRGAVAYAALSREVMQRCGSQLADQCALSSPTVGSVPTDSSLPGAPK